MTDLAEKDYLVIVQCDIVKQRCPGYLCERNVHERTGAFAAYPADKPVRMINMTCSGCCGRALHRKLSLLARRLEKKEGIGRDRLIVQLASCITRENYHAPPCPHKDYLTSLIDRLGIDSREDTVMDETAEARRTEGLWQRP